MGVPVAYIRKFSDKLQIEMLRAYKPERYKTPGAQINLATKGDVFVLTEEQRHILMDYKRNELLAYQAQLQAPPAEEPREPRDPPVVQNGPASAEGLTTNRDNK
jgi:hypothetical protein